MLPSAMVVEIQAYGFDAIDTRIYPLLTRANRRVCALAPFPFTEKFATWTETVGTPGTPLGASSPQDVRAVRQLGMPAVGENGGNVSYLRRDLLEKTYGYNSYLLQDFPRHYNVYGRNSTGGANIYVYPYIAISTVFTLDYHARPPVLGAGTTEAQMLLPDDYCEVIQNIALAELARSDGDLEDASMYTNWANAGMAAMLNEFDANQDTPDPMLLTNYEDGWFG